MSYVKPGTTSFPKYVPVGQNVSVNETHVHIQLADGRSLDVPITHWGFLARATPEQRQRWQFEPGNEIIYWPELDDGLAIAHLLGMPED